LASISTIDLKMANSTTQRKKGKIRSLRSDGNARSEEPESCPDAFRLEKFVRGDREAYLKNGRESLISWEKGGKCGVEGGGNMWVYSTEMRYRIKRGNRWEALLKPISESGSKRAGLRAGKRNLKSALLSGGGRESASYAWIDA